MPPTTVDVTSIKPKERFSPTQPRTGLKPGKGLYPTSAGVVPANVTVYAGAVSVTSIPSGESWAYFGGLHPHVGLYPHEGLYPRGSGLTWMGIIDFLEGIESQEEWGLLEGVDSFFERTYILLQMPSHGRQRINQ